MQLTHVYIYATSDENLVMGMAASNMIQRNPDGENVRVHENLHGKFSINIEISSCWLLLQAIFFPLIQMKPFAGD